MFSRQVLLSSLLCSLLAAPSLAQSSRLHPSQEYKRFWEEVDGPPRIYRVRLSKNRKLVAVGDTLFLLNNRNRVLWNWVAAAPLWDTPILDSQGTIYVVGPDLLWAAVDSATGKQKWHSTMNGRAAFSQIKLYRNDMYLVLTDMWGYRDSLHDPTIKDRLTLCKANAILWRTEIPARSKLQVRSNNAFVVYKRHGRFIRIRVPIPRHVEKPLGRISVLADYEGRKIIDEK
jgi:hypothetical protein